jgi:hypothetical protein
VVFGRKRVFLVIFKGFRSKLVQNPVFGLFLIKKGGQKGPFLDHFWGGPKRTPQKRAVLWANRHPRGPKKGQKRGF